MWKNIPKYSGYYQVNENGEVRSVERVIKDGKHGSKIFHKTYGISTISF